MMICFFLYVMKGFVSIDALNVRQTIYLGTETCEEGNPTTKLEFGDISLNDCITKGGERWFGGIQGVKFNCKEYTSLKMDFFWQNDSFGGCSGEPGLSQMFQNDRCYTSEIYPGSSMKLEYDDCLTHTTMGIFTLVVIGVGTLILSCTLQLFILHYCGALRKTTRRGDENSYVRLEDSPSPMRQDFLNEPNSRMLASSPIDS